MEVKLSKKQIGVVVGIVVAVVVEDLWIKAHPQYGVLSKEELHNLFLESLGIACPPVRGREEQKRWK